MKNRQEFRSTCTAPRGSGPRGVEWADVERKYHDLAPLAGLTPAQVDASLAFIRHLDEGAPVAQLINLINVKS